MLPRIDIQELIQLVIERRRKVRFVDARPAEELEMLGPIRDSVRLLAEFEGPVPAELLDESVELVVVVHDYRLAERLLLAQVPRLCTLIGCSLPPDFYC